MKITNKEQMLIELLANKLYPDKPLYSNIELKNVIPESEIIKYRGILGSLVRKDLAEVWDNGSGRQLIILTKNGWDNIRGKHNISEKEINETVQKVCDFWNIGADEHNVWCNLTKDEAATAGYNCAVKEFRDRDNTLINILKEVLVRIPQGVQERNELSKVIMILERKL